MSAFEGSEFGVGDFVLLENIQIDDFLKNLKLRFEKNRIYTYIGEVVVSINPYRNLDNYGPELVNLFLTNNFLTINVIFKNIKSCNLF